MIGGIAANNASGMCCGTAQNSYRTLRSMRLVLADGTALDTGDAGSRETFARSHAGFLTSLSSLAERVRSNETLAGRIRRKYGMKNTTGYGLNALVDFTDPVEILQHLMIGSEGTLGFISEITYRTVPEPAHKATALLLFPDIETACRAVALLKQTPVSAVELMDRASLRSVQDKPGMPPTLAGLEPSVAALLVETGAPSEDTLQEQINAVRGSLQGIPTVFPPSFTADPAEYTALWNIRKGLFPSVGAMRRAGTTVIIEDVAFPVPRLAEATLDLQSILLKYGYHEAIIFGHALEGNLHFVFTQDFSSQSEVNRYGRLLDEVSRLVVHKYDGALKAEHGTGRNMAPYVEMEWGQEAVRIMEEIKRIFDPLNILNPGVILNPDREIHVKNLKPMPAAREVVDKCIECGFCEVMCPSKDLTLTPRQRIVIYREMAYLRTESADPARLASLSASYNYFGDHTCATDGLCATACPVGIDTGKLIKELREESSSPTARSIAGTIGAHMGAVTTFARLALRGASVARSILGARTLAAASGAARRLSGGRLPQWNPQLPHAARRIPRTESAHTQRARVVYFHTCVNRIFGTTPAEGDSPDLSALIVQLCGKAGYDVVLPPRLDGLCCGMAFASKGFRAEGDRKARELERVLTAVSEGGRLAVLVDMSPCLYRMKETTGSRLSLYEPVRFALEHLVPHLRIERRAGTVAVHTTCSSEKMGLASPLRSLAALCAERVVVPDGVGCCGWAGDRGFTVPELNASALRSLKSGLPEGCTQGYSTSRTCEIGLAHHSGIPYRSILYLLDECSDSR
jgi:D-lactate dehydrogenase